MWQCIDDKHELENVGGARELGNPFRVYGENGNVWPRISVSLSPDVMNGEPTHYILHAARKDDDESDWWTSCGIPLECYNNVIEMIQDFIKPKSQ